MKEKKPQLEIKFYTGDLSIDDTPKIEVEGVLYIGEFKWEMRRYYDHKEYYKCMKRIFNEMSYALISSSFASVPKTEGSETR